MNQKKLNYIYTKITSPSSLPNTGGNITISVDETVLHSLIKGSAPVNFGQILIIDENGDIITHSNKDFLYNNISTFSFGNRIIDEISKNPLGYFIDKVDGADYIISYVTSDYNTWNYVTLQPIAQLTEAKFNYLGKTIALIAVITLLFGFTVSYLSTKNILTFEASGGNLQKLVETSFIQ